MSDLLIGIDIGGTKCAVVLGNTVPEILYRVEFPTDAEAGSDYTVEKIKDGIRDILGKADRRRIKAIGISCGGPLDSKRGVILSPPNLPGWDNISIVKILEDQFGIPTALQNDANACALAEWRWGAGRGTRNMIFLTFGTGLGAGLILDGKLYTGTNDMAGEAGHIRLENSGPAGYGKEGSFEGFCSGGGIARQAEAVLFSENYRETEYYKKFNGTERITARDICTFAAEGDSTALEILRNSGRRLGMGLSILIDLLNPECIVIGSVFTRCREFIEPAAMEVIYKETLKASMSVCSVVPAFLGDSIGDYGSISVALNALAEG